MNNAILRRKVHGKKLENMRFGVFDLETDGLGGEFICGGIYDPENGYRTYTNLISLIEDLFSHPEIEWWTHNGCRYDYTYFTKEEVKRWILEKGWSLRFMMTKLQSIGIQGEHKSHKKKIKFKDFYRFIPESLEKIGKKFDVEHIKLTGSIDWENEKFDPQNSLHCDYLRHDVLGLYEVIEKFCTLIWEHFGVVPGWTGPGTAMSAWQKTIPSDHAHFRHCKRKRDFFRNAYYGGMVQVRYAEIPDGLYGSSKEGLKLDYFDVNSMYPTRMLEGVPVGTPIRIKEYKKELPGFYHVKVQVPDEVFPMIPFRDKNGTKWPVGEFETYVSSKEIEFAQNLGCTFDVIEGYYFTRTEQIFDEFINKCKELRYQHKGTPLEVCAKLMQNSLYGKFGSGESTKCLYLSNEKPEKVLKAYNRIDEETGDIIDDIWECEEEIDVPYLFPHWAAWITAGARITLSDLIIKAGKRFVYCDTDSVVYIANGLENPLVETDPKEYGKWKHEATFSDWVCAGPKTYAGKTEEGWKVKNKGLDSRRVTHDHIKRSVQGEKVLIPMISLSSLNVLLKLNHNGPKANKIERTVTTPVMVQGFNYDPLEKTFSPLKFSMNSG
jgi:hypothetical protein